MDSLVSTASDVSNTILPPPKKRWSGASPHSSVHGPLTATSNKASAAEKSTRQKRPFRTHSWRVEEPNKDPVNDPTASEVDVAQTLLHLTPRPQKRRCRGPVAIPLLLKRPEGLPPLYGTAKEVEAARPPAAIQTQRPQPSGNETATVAVPMQVHPARVAHLVNRPTLTKSGTLLLNAPYLLIPGNSQTSPMVLTEHPFHHNLNNLHAAAGKLTELVRQGQMPSPFLAKLRSEVPPAVFQPEFHREIEQVRVGKRERLLIKPPVPIFTKKQTT